MQTTGSPRTLKEVFSNTPQPVRCSNCLSSRQKSGCRSRPTVCTRAEPSTCVTAGSVESACFNRAKPADSSAGLARRWLFATSATSSMYGDSAVRSKYSPARSSSTAGANGRNDSRNLTFWLIADCIEAKRASPRIERLPSERGPNSIRP